MALALIHSRQVACWPWHLRHCGEEPARPAFCRTCQREVALPVSTERDAPVCIYCGIDSGLVEAIDRPFDEVLP